MNDLSITTERIPNSDQVLSLYTDAEWSAYTNDPERLAEGIKNSTYVLYAWDGDDFIGLCRVVSDGNTIAYIQDILILKAYQRRGIGKRLLSEMLEKLNDIRQIILMTDNEESGHAFYRSLGFCKMEEINCSGFVYKRNV